MSTSTPGTTRPRYARKKTTPGRIICVGTHHKTGTVWMRKVFRGIANDQDIPFMQVNRAKRMADIPETGPCICVNWHSAFPPEMLAHPDARFIHIIRDPRDVLLSGLRYHRVAGLGNEKFLREKRDEWGGKNYQDHLNSITDEHDALIFEMEHKHHETLQEMLHWDYGHPNSIEIAYEDLIEDTDCSLFRDTLEKIAAPGVDIDRAVQVYWDKSLFGGLAKKEDRESAVPGEHVASGKPAQWVENLPRDVAETYVKRYGNDLKELKYEKNLKWVADCKPRETEPA
ncbi:MAG: sulfotransferase domain-containing protein [Pseudomonadota bacterium]